MPAVAIGAIAAGAMAAGEAALAGTVILGLSTTLSAAVIGIASAALSAVVSLAMAALSPGSSPSSPLSYDADKRTQMVKQAITAWRTVYGEIRVSGPITFLHTTGSTNQYTHILLTLACHPIEAVTEVYFGDELVKFDPDTHEAIGRWNGYAKCWVGLGTIAGDADLQAALEAACPGVWTSEHRQYGRAKLYVVFTYDSSATVYTNQIPTVTCVVKGKNTIVDPRTGTTGYTNNAALCIRDYLVTKDVGLAISAGRMLEADNIASANVSGELVACKHAQFIAAGTGTVIGDMTGEGGLAAAFDGVTSSTIAYCATVTAASGHVGKDWGSGNARIIARVMAYSPTAYGWVEDYTGNVMLSLKGSNDGTEWTTLYSETVSDAEEEQAIWNPDQDDIDQSAAYRYHAVFIEAPGSASTIAVAEVRFYELIDTEVRYACNGTVDHDGTPKDILAKLLTSCAGNVVFSGGKWSILAGYYRTPTITLTDSDFTGSFKVATRIGRADSFNACKGTYVSPDNSWEASDGPPVRNGTYEVEDGLAPETFTASVSSNALTATSSVVAGTAFRCWSDGTLPAPLTADTTYFAVGNGASFKVASTRTMAIDGTSDITITNAGTGPHTLRFGTTIWSDSDLPYTTSSSMFQRLKKISLERMRQQQAAEVACNLTAMRLRAGDTVMVTRDRLGWTDKVFEVANWKFQQQTDSEGNPILGVALQLKETAASVYDWNAGEETAVDPAPDTALPPAWDVDRPSNLVLSSGTGQLLALSDGTIVSRILVTWTDPKTSAARVNVQFKLESATIWQDVPPVPVGVGQTFISSGIQDGEIYLVRLQGESILGAKSAWVMSAPHAVVGKTEPPSDPSGLYLTGGYLVWSQPTMDEDLAGWRIRHLAGKTRNWAQGADYPTSGSPLTEPRLLASLLGTGAQTVMVRSVDTSGNLSSGILYLTTGLGEASPDNVIITYDLAGAGFPGAIANGTVSGGVLVANDTGDAYLPDNNALYLPDINAPYLPLSYKAMVYEFSYIASASDVPGTLRLSASIDGEGWQIQYRRRGSAGLYLGRDEERYLPDEDALYLGGADPWGSWTGSLDIRAEMIDFRIACEAGTRQGIVSALTLSIDVADITESFDDLVISAGGSRVPITKTYREIDHIGAIVLQDDGNGAVAVLVMDLNPALGPLLKAVNGSGTSVQATIDIINMKGH